MKILFIGGTGTISMAITRLLAARGDELYLLNRGSRSNELPANVKVIRADIGNEEGTAKALEGMELALHHHPKVRHPALEDSLELPYSQSKPAVLLETLN